MRADLTAPKPPDGYVSVDLNGNRGLFRHAVLGVPESDALHTWVPVWFDAAVPGIDQLKAPA